MEHGGKREGAGRRKGTVNKRTRELVQLLDDKGYCPVGDLIWAGEVAKKEYERSAEIFDAILDQKAKDGVRTPTQDMGPQYLATVQRSAEGVMPYLYPKRKAIEFEGEAAKSLTDFFKLLANK